MRKQVYRNNETDLDGNDAVLAIVINEKRDEVDVSEAA